MTPERPANATDAAVTFVEQIVVDAVDRMTTDRFVALEAVVDQQSAVINELRDTVLVLYGQVEATHKLVATVIGVKGTEQHIPPTPRPKPVKEG